MKTASRWPSILKQGSKFYNHKKLGSYNNVNDFVSGFSSETLDEISA